MCSKRNSTPRIVHQHGRTPALSTIRKSSCLEAVTEEASKTIEYENAYFTYILRKAQNRILQEDQKTKLEALKKSLVFMKLAYEELLNIHVMLSKEVTEMKMYINDIAQLRDKIADGKKVLKILGDNEFQVAIKQLTNNINQVCGRLKLDGISEDAISEAFKESILGYNSYMFKILKKIHNKIKGEIDIASKSVCEVGFIIELDKEIQLLRNKYDAGTEEIIGNCIAQDCRRFLEMAQSMESDLSVLSLNADCSGNKTQDASTTFDSPITNVSY